MPGPVDDENLISDETTEGHEEENDETQNTGTEENEEGTENQDEDATGEEERSGEDEETEEDEEDEEEGEGEDELDLEDEDEEGEEDDELSEDEVINAAKEKYPNLYKEFPDLRKFVYLGRQLSNVFPTLESAEEASEKAELMDGLAFSLADGNAVPLLNSLEAASEDGSQLTLFADKILGALHKKDKALFARATMPVVANAARLLHSFGVQNKNKNAVAAAKIFAKFFFPDGQLPNGQIVSDGENAEAEQLKKQLADRDDREHNTFNQQVQADTNKIIEGELKESLKGKKLTDMQRDTLIEKIINKTKDLLRSNPQHMRKMILLQKQAFKHGHSTTLARKLQNEWLASARPVIKMVQARLTAKFMGESTVGKDGKKKKFKKPLSSGGTGGKGDEKNKTTKDGKAPTPDWGAMRKSGISDADYLLGKEILPGKK